MYIENPPRLIDFRLPGACKTSEMLESLDRLQGVAPPLCFSGSQSQGNCGAAGSELTTRFWCSPVTLFGTYRRLSNSSSSSVRGQSDPRIATGFGPPAPFRLSGRRAVVGLVIGIADALNLLAATWTRLVETAMDCHFGPEGRDFFREVFPASPRRRSIQRVSVEWWRRRAAPTHRV